jgi:hypothetical protein
MNRVGSGPFSFLPRDFSRNLAMFRVCSNPSSYERIDYGELRETAEVAIGSP